MNRGIVVGHVYTEAGAPAKGAYVMIYRVFGGSQLGIEKFEVRARSDGSFQVPFLWSPVEWASDLSVITIRMIAWTQEGDLLKDGYSRDTSHVALNVRGYLVRDILHPLNIVTGNPFASVPDMADFSISIGQAIAHYKNLVPFWKVSQVAETEGWIIGAGVDLWLDNTN